VVTGVGCAGLLPTIAAIEAGKDIALANKETLVAGDQSFCLWLRNINSNSYQLTQSILQFFRMPQGAGCYNAADFAHGVWGRFPGLACRKVGLCARSRRYLKHPNWSMESQNHSRLATLMNKGLEVIGSLPLWSGYDHIEIVIPRVSFTH